METIDITIPISEVLLPDVAAGHFDSHILEMVRTAADQWVDGHE